MEFHKNDSKRINRVLANEKRDMDECFLKHYKIEVQTGQ